MLYVILSKLQHDHEWQIEDGPYNSLAMAREELFHCLEWAKQSDASMRFKLVKLVKVK